MHGITLQPADLSRIEEAEPSAQRCTSTGEGGTADAGTDEGGRVGHGAMQLKEHQPILNTLALNPLPPGALVEAGANMAQIYAQHVAKVNGAMQLKEQKPISIDGDTTLIFSGEHSITVVVTISATGTPQLGQVNQRFPRHCLSTHSYVLVCCQLTHSLNPMLMYVV